ncbi:MAG: helix-turn-helix domain-containing protein [Eggerthellaceae bacterium]|nr:helix-turn-helix domain-containing protein [Eggerthellaceae bacterium]
MAETARHSFIARNTCFYRIKRMQELSGLDLSDPDERVCLEIALRTLI